MQQLGFTTLLIVSVIVSAFITTFLVASLQLNITKGLLVWICLLAISISFLAGEIPGTGIGFPPILAPIIMFIVIIGVMQLNTKKGNRSNSNLNNI